MYRTELTTLDDLPRHSTRYDSIGQMAEMFRNNVDGTEIHEGRTSFNSKSHIRLSIDDAAQLIQLQDLRQSSGDQLSMAPYPFASARLTFRSIRAADITIFNAINADTQGFINSSTTNIRLPSESDASKRMKEFSEKCLLGAVIWLSHAGGTNQDEIQELKDKSLFGEATVEEYGTAIGELHMSRLEPDEVHHRFTEIGLAILPEYQGKGYGGEAINWALDYAFRCADMHRVCDLTGDSERFLVKLTFRRSAYVHLRIITVLFAYMRDWGSSTRGSGGMVSR